MERKRAPEGAPDARGPPAKHYRTAADVPDDPPDAAPLVAFQRAQLAAKIADQERDMRWLRAKVDELQQLVAVLDAAPRAALYHMGQVREDLTLTLARLGLNGELLPEHSPIAATMLDAEVVTNESLGEMPSALKRLTAQIVLAIEGKDTAAATNHQVDGAGAENSRDRVMAELHARVRQVSDQLERYAERDKQSLVSSTTFRDEFEDVRAEFSIRRRRIVALELQLKDKLCASRDSDSDDPDGKSCQRGERPGAQSSTDPNSRDHPETGTHQSNAGQNGKASDLIAAEAEARELSEKRLEELKAMHEERKTFVSEVVALRADIARREAGVVPMKAILATALYQTMEVTLQQLYLKERTWEVERQAQAEEREAERKDAEERLEEVRNASERGMEDVRRQMEELRRIADAAKAEKDKVVMTYEARKMEAGNAAMVVAAAESRVAVSEEMRNKLAASNATLSEEIGKLRCRVADQETELAEKSSTPDATALVKRLQQDLEEERAKSAGFIQEVESLSNMFAEVEGENDRLVKVIAENEQVLSKVMAERLRGRQLLTTVKEENRALLQGREIDNEKIKSLNACVAASKKLAVEATAASNKALEEARALGATLEKRRRIADEATVSARTALAEKEEMKRERDAYIVREAQTALSVQEDRFNLERQKEELANMTKRFTAAEAANMSNGRPDSIRDEIIRELRKKLNCSVVTSKPKEVVLLRCGHLFSKQCTEDLVAARNRKCPICGKPFGTDDIRSVFF